MIALVIASGFGGDFLARKIWEWQSFHGLHRAAIDRVFTVMAHSTGRSGASLELLDSATERTFSISCEDAMVAATSVGDWLILPVETGRGGAQRFTLPTLHDLRRTRWLSRQFEPPPNLTDLDGGGEAPRRD
jgi:hypothetical protein